MEKFEKYEKLCEEIKFQMKFIDDAYCMDFDYFIETLQKLKDIQNEILNEIR